MKDVCRNCKYYKACGTHRNVPCAGRETKGGKKNDSSRTN